MSVFDVSQTYQIVVKVNSKTGIKSASPLRKLLKLFKLLKCWGFKESRKYCAGIFVFTDNSEQNVSQKINKINKIRQD